MRMDVISSQSQLTESLGRTFALLAVHVVERSSLVPNCSTHAAASGTHTREQQHRAAVFSMDVRRGERLTVALRTLERVHTRVRTVHEPRSRVEQRVQWARVALRVT